MSACDFSKRPAVTANGGASDPQASAMPAPPMNPSGEAVAGWVRPCPECDGEGEVSNGRGRGGNDPDSWMVECEDCDGEGYFPCEVCGNTVIVPGFDCFACEAVQDVCEGISAAQLEILHRCMGENMARAAESYAPAGAA